MSNYPVGEEIDKNDPSPSNKIQHLVKEERVHKIVLFDKTERLSECFMVHMKDLLAELNCYELFYVKWFFLNRFFFKKFILSRESLWP